MKIMLYTPVTSFRRPIDAVQLKHQKLAQRPQPIDGVSKWSALKELTVARKHFGLSDRAIAVLQTLLSFYPETVLKGSNLVVFPSNAAICGRLGGMACSTMRRHLAALVDTGLILRRDSPNGKRYVKRSQKDPLAFGFDLTPLVARFDQITQLADQARDAEDAFQQLRRSVSLMKRDIIGLTAMGQQQSPDLSLWDAYDDLVMLTARAMRRTLTLEQLETIFTTLETAITELHGHLKTSELSTCDRQNEQHIQTSKKESIDIEEPEVPQTRQSVSLGDVLDKCAEFQLYVDGPIRDEQGFLKAAETVRPMIGISESVWFEAIQNMGRWDTAVCVVAMLERLSEIRVPNAYLRALSLKSLQGRLNCKRLLTGLTWKQAV